MTDSVTSRLEQGYSGAVYDVLRARGFPDQVLPAAIRPLDPTRKLVGRVFTVEGRPDPHLDAHESLLAWTEFLSRAPSGHVVICQPNDSTLAHMGELSAETLHFRGVRGYVVDGGCRDTDFILKLGFPVFCSFTTPKDIVAKWVPDRFGEPITIGDVTVCTGDFLIGDRDGVVVIPGRIAEEVVAKTEEAVRTENKVRSAILAGMDPQAAYLKYGKF